MNHKIIAQFSSVRNHCSLIFRNVVRNVNLSLCSKRRWDTISLFTFSISRLQKINEN